MASGDISFATFNLYNLNEPGVAIYEDADGWSQKQYERKVAWSGRMLDCLKADVFGFQELWHRASLQAIFTSAELADDYDLLAPDNAIGERIVCGAAVRKGWLVGQPEWIETFPADFRLQSSGDDPQTPDILVALNGYSRPVLHFQVRPRPDSPVIHVYVCHFKSKGPTEIDLEDWFKAQPNTYKPHETALGSALSTIRRTAEATALRWVLTQRMRNSDAPVVVLGDLNDGKDSNTLAILTGQPNYLKAWSRPAGSDTALYSAQALQQLQSLNDVYYTYVFKQTRESLDHVLVSEQFYDGSTDRIWSFDQLTIENDHLNFPNAHKDRGTGDHGVVRVGFRWRPAE